MSQWVILVVDDEEPIRRLLARLLSTLGKVQTASSAAEALLLLENEEFDVILSDHDMPGRSGSELLAEVSRRWPTTARILMSGNYDLNSVNAGKREGGLDYFLHKPFEVKELMTQIRERAAQARARRQV